MGIPFTDLLRAGSMKRWRATDAPFLDWTIRGRSKRWTTASAKSADAGSRSAGFGGRAALSVLTVRGLGNRGKCPMDYCGAGVVMDVHL